MWYLLQNEKHMSNVSHKKCINTCTSATNGWQCLKQAMTRKPSLAWNDHAKKKIRYACVKLTCHCSKNSYSIFYLYTWERITSRQAVLILTYNRSVSINKNEQWKIYSYYSWIESTREKITYLSPCPERLQMLKLIEEKCWSNAVPYICVRINYKICQLTSMKHGKN